MSGAELFFIAASTALATAQTISQANNQAKLANFNAQVAGQNAEASRRQAAADESRQRRAFARSLARRRTGFSAAGVSLDGSPLDLLEDVAAENELDLLGIRQRGLAQSREFTLSASESRFRASTARQQGLLGAGVQLASGSARFAGRFPREKKFEPTPFRGFNLEDARPFPGDPE